MARASAGAFTSARSILAPVIECISAKGGQIVILLGGGTKQHQQSDSSRALERWEDYKHRKKQQKEKEKEKEEE
jgi:hypothetical protein